MSLVVDLAHLNGIGLFKKDIENFLITKTRPEVYSSALFSTLPLSELVILEMVKIWPFYGQNMVLTWSLKWFLPESQSMYQGMLLAKVCFSG